MNASPLPSMESGATQLKTFLNGRFAYHVPEVIAVYESLLGYFVY